MTARISLVLLTLGATFLACAEEPTLDGAGGGRRAPSPGLVGTENGASPSSAGKPGAAGAAGADGGAIPDGGATSPPGSTTNPGDLPVTNSLQVQLVPEVAANGPRRVNFAVPLAPGALTDEKLVEVKAGGVALPSARRAIARWSDGSVRSVQIQIELAVNAATTIDVAIGQPASGGELPLIAAAQTLVPSNGATVPAVWAVLPAAHLAASRFAGPALPSADVAGTTAAAWDRVCNYATFGSAAFEAASAEQGSWLFDRPTALYRGYQRSGSAATLRSAFREASIYREGITGTGSSTRIGVAASDLKYHYTQGLALHYLLTGDDRFREAAENVAVRVHDLWTSPGYAGGADFWTERHAGFGLLAYEWAIAITDDQAATFSGWASTAVDAYLAMQATYPAGYTSTTERCFAHHADAHGEGYGYFGCSPWMSAIVADGLDTHADRRARAGDAAGASLVRESLVRLGRFIATRGRDATGKPYYWAGVGVTSNEIDDFDEHWGESAYVVALAWHWSGKSDAQLRQAASELTAGFDQNGEAGQLRSFNWQCRTGVIAPFYLRP